RVRGLRGRAARRSRRAHRRSRMAGRRLPRDVRARVRPPRARERAGTDDGGARLDDPGLRLDRLRARLRPPPAPDAGRGEAGRVHRRPDRVRRRHARLPRRPRRGTAQPRTPPVAEEDLGGAGRRRARRCLRLVHRALRGAPSLPRHLAGGRAGTRRRHGRGGRRSVRVGAEARSRGEGHRKPPGRPRGDARPDRRSALRRAGGLFPRPRVRISLTPYTDPVKRVALLGATGSIGRQAIEIVEAHPELELCAAASGSTSLDDVDAPLKEVGGDLTELLERAQPDVVLNAVVGFAGVHATLWTLEHGVDLALANKESLVAAGELALAARERGRGRILPVDSEHSALFQCLEGREPEQVDTLVLTGSGGPFRGRSRAELEDVTPEQAL